jgi:membrane fusion protein (multidrug efflux system)
MPSKKTHLVIAVVGIAILGAAAWLWQRKGDASIPRAVGGTASAAVQGPSAAGKGNPGHGPGGAGAPAPVEVGLVQALRVSDDVQTVGSLRSRRGVMLRPEAAGRIVQINFADGQRVKGGQLLVQLDDTLQRAQLQQAEAQATIARTNLQRSRELLAGVQPGDRVVIAGHDRLRGELVPVRVVELKPAAGGRPKAGTNGGGAGSAAGAGASAASGVRGPLPA